MNDQAFRRTLAAIVMADVVGYSRLMGRDEAGTVDRLKRYRREVIDPTIARYRGRVVNAAGDSLLLEFGSVVDATLCAVAMQQGLAERNASLDELDRLRFRMGVNIGDVIARDGALFGDSVNVAARIETLAEPGGICLSSSAHEQVRGKIDAAFTDMGARRVKNIERPVEVFALSAAAIDAAPRALPPARRARPPLFGAMVAAALVVGAFAFAVPYVRSRGTAAFASRVDLILKDTQTKLSDKARSQLIADYLAFAPHRAFAIATIARSHWWTGDWPSAETATEKALERCQLAFDEPCALLAADETLPSASSERATRDMPRLHYAGDFDPEQIPGVRAPVVTRADVVGYLAARGPKAAAIHARGLLTIVTGGTSQRRAEIQALKSCNEDAARQDEDGPCYLYAAADQVVLPQRKETALTKP